MSEQEPDGPYVYQPFGSVSHPEHNKAGRLWAVSGLHPLARIEGLTRMEADAVQRTLVNLREPVVAKPNVEHDWEFYTNGSFCRRCGAAIGSGVPCR